MRLFTACGNPQLEVGMDIINNLTILVIGEHKVEKEAVLPVARYAYFSTSVMLSADRKDTILRNSRVGPRHLGDVETPHWSWADPFHRSLVHFSGSRRNFGTSRNQSLFHRHSIAGFFWIRQSSINNFLARCLFLKASKLNAVQWHRFPQKFTVDDTHHTL